MVRKALFWSVSGQMVMLLVTFLGSIAIARLLSPMEMGVYAVAMAAIGVLQLFTAFGVGAYIVRETDFTPQKLDAAFTINLILSVGLAAVIFAFGVFGAFLLDEPAVASVLQLLAVTPLLSAVSFGPSVMLQRGMLFRGSSIIGAIGATIAAGVTIIAALMGASSMSPAYGSVISSAFSTIALLAIGREHFRLRLSLFEWRKMTVFGVRLMSIGGVSQAAVRVSDIVIANFLGLAALGLYSRATNLNNLIFTNIYGTMTRVVFTQLSNAQRDGDRVTEVYLGGLQMIAAVMGPLLIGLAILAQPAVLLCYGPRWVGAADLLSLLLIGQFIALAFAMNWELFVVRDDLKTQTWLEISRSFLGVFLITAASVFSLVVVAASAVVNSVISVLIYEKHVRRLARVQQGRLMRIYGEAIALTLAATAPSLVLMISTDFSNRTSFLSIAVAVGLGVICWLFLLRRIDHPLMKEIQTLWFNARGLAEV